MERLFLLSESRGKEAAGLALASADALTVYKEARSASKMLRTPGYRKIVRVARNGTSQNGASGHPAAVTFIGHTRLVTDGVSDVNINNQPVSWGGVVGIHNGIVVNHEALWQQHHGLQRQTAVDSEVIFALLRSNLDAGASLASALRQTFEAISGAASIAVLFDDAETLLLATNNGSLYYRHVASDEAFVFASESHILEQLGAEARSVFASAPTLAVRPWEYVLVDLATLQVEHLPIRGERGDRRLRDSRRQVIDLSPRERPAPRKRPPAAREEAEALAARFPYRSMRDALRRCTRCVLPETMPFIDFDDDGVCNYCRNYQPLVIEGHDALESLVGSHRRTDGRPDCVVGVSGGRDSMYGLHYIKTVLKMNPVAYTYDWGMVTDLARRNVSRICGKLGVEHILVSADIAQKRRYIRKNVEAWLRVPSLGTVPLFMAGDKAYFYYLNRVRQQVGVNVAFLCENFLERTDFKTGFAGVPPVAAGDHTVNNITKSAKLKLASYYARQFLKNPRYLNTSLLDTAKAFVYYYGIPKDFHNLYGFVPWYEKTVNEVLLGDYDFELAEDTETTWRIGDGTAAFYNYIYYSIAGFTENDAFRSNQIREGRITRDEALERIDRENRPRFQSIQWYLQTIGIQQSTADVLERIERAPKLYRQP